MKNKKLAMSFKNAYNGLKHAFLHERNMRIHVLAAAAGVILGIVLSLDPLRWALLAIAAGLVFIAEQVNTAVENIVDMITSDYSEKAKTVKDIAAGAVLVAAVVAVITGVLVFIGPFVDFLGRIL